VNAERHERAIQLFQRALDRQASERSDFLHTVCGTDETLREEVESLLAHHDSRTITPPRSTSSNAQSAPVTSVESSLGRLVPGRLRPANKDRYRASLAALALALILAAVGYWLNAAIERSLRENLAGQLQATLESNIAAVTNWLELQRHDVRQWAGHPQLRENFPALVELAQQTDASLDDLRASQPHHDTLKLLLPLLKSDEVRAVNGTDRVGLLVLTSRDTLQERYQLTEQGRKVIAPVFLGQTILLPPTLGRTLVENEIPGIVDVPIILVGSPVKDAQGHVIGGLFASIESGREFARLLSLGRAGAHGDNVAFGPRGEILSFQSQGGRERSKRPLADVAAQAMAAEDHFHIDLDGYVNDRGVQVVGAAKWLDDYGFGVVSDVEYATAYAPLRHLRQAFGSVFGLLVLASAAAYVSSLSAIRLQREVGAARQLGQYRLTQLIGEGGMGKVYKAHHALLRRPSAIKILDGGQADARTIARFEREVQLASSLTHPNTVEIYDYGRTEEGIFYYAMEYLPGITLDQLVKRHGPVGTPRMLFIFRQILASLTEAHELGLVHRDIKPANIILCRRGGQWDFVKVVDFGLAKDLSFKLSPQITQTGIISGTPLYIAPECLDDPGNCSIRSDIYALGVVGFYLLAGRDLFVGDNPFHLFQQISQDSPPRVSDIIGSVPPELDDLISRCVAKSPAARPASTREMLAVLEPLAATHLWTEDDAQNWWQKHEAQITMGTSCNADASSDDRI
jgi:hypothetical protein